jgi:two-component system phosphate regulon sensor histidine kinase PhoR
MQSALVKSILRGLPQPLVLLGADGRIVAANAAATELLGPAIEGRHYITVLRQPALLDAIEGTLRHRQPAHARYLVSGTARESVWKVLAAPVEGEGDAGVLVSFLDTTDMEQAGQMRRDFVANVSHELRTPLSSLLGFVETLRGPARDDKDAQDKFLTIMHEQAERMSRLIEDLLSLSRIEMDEHTRPRGHVDLRHVLGNVKDMLTIKAAARHMRIELDIPEWAGPVPGDADQLTQVFQNLIDNALKYGREGTAVEVTVTRPTERELSVSVTDHGEGIAPQHLPRLTERFYRVDAARSRQLGGTGLGLAIVKHIVNRHRGHLTVDSNLGEGSRFSVTLPAA